jgi:hybrid polyketide synthase/nonribosomal peptide synthetase ACE1
MRLSDKVSRLLKSVGVESTIIEDVTALNKVEIAPRSVVLSLTDLDEAMFEEIDEDKLDGLKKLLDSAKVMLWVTQGRRSQDPFANMGIGFSVTLNLEMPLLRTQFLDLEMGKNPDAELIVETLLSLQAVDNFEATSAQNPITWSVEPEIIQEDSRLMIPRLRHIKAANDRHNSKKRAITAEVSPQTSRVSLEYDGKTYALKEVSKLRKETTETGQVQIEVSHSSIAAVRTSAAAHYFVVVGKAVDSGVRLLGLAQENSSLVNVSNYLAMPCNVAPGEEGALIRSVVDDLLSSYILSLPGCGKSVLVHEPEPDFAAILEKRAAYYGVTVQFSTAKPKERPSSWTSIHPLATSRLVRSALPRNISCFVNCEEVHGKATVGDRIVACLPAFCERLALDDLLARACPHSAKTSEDGIGEMLRASAARASKDTKHAIISLTDVVAPGAAVQELAVVDWNVPSDISVKVQSLDSSTIFASDKTYVLFGLTSDLAQSLCRWMISHGARNVVLTSRNPKIEAQWMQEVELEGATVKVYANDITSDKAVQDLCHEIETTMPPVAGIANGAMVLVDTMITEMTVETWERVVKPKVNGSIYLERIFADKPLDFFIFFSSIAAVYGNEGQSNYGAANMYMTSLAYQRRQRGQPASVLHIGPITGAGYITREASDNVLSWVVNHGHCLLSQNDFFAGFAEAMLAGRPDLGLCPEVVLDERFNPGKETTGVNPKFQFTLPRIADEGKGSGLMTVSSARAGLAEATTAKEVYDIVKGTYQRSRI